MTTIIGLRREDINPWERRTPLIPAHVRELRERHGLDVRVQRSSIRVFGDDDYRREGATVADDLAPCRIIFGLKEIPVDVLERGKVYVFFSHTAKGQPFNMPMLGKLMDLGCTLIDYEKMTDEQGRRVLFFGRQAGQAGMIDALWALGYRLTDVEGIASPFALIKQTYHYQSLVEAKEAVAHLGRHIARDGVPPDIDPCVFGFLGYGHVSQGAQDIFDLLPHVDVAPRDLPALIASGERNTRRLVKCVFKEEDMVRPVEPGAVFDLQDYYRNPEKYEAVVEESIAGLTVLVNGVYWTPRYPRFVTKSFLKQLYAAGRGNPRLRVIADVTCDIEGSMGCTVKATDPKNPVYVYDPLEDVPLMGFRGRGPVVLAVYNLPAELPLESSIYFSQGLKEYVPAIAGGDYDARFEDCRLPDVVRKAVILFRGRLAPDFGYLEEHLRRAG